MNIDIKNLVGVVPSLQPVVSHNNFMFFYFDFLTDLGDTKSLG